MTGKDLCETTRDGDTAKVSTLLSTQDAQSFINYQDAHGITSLHEVVVNGHAAVTEKLIVSRSNVDLHRRNDNTPVHDATVQGFETVTKRSLLLVVVSIFRTRMGSHRSSS